jgi:hypothetical protein
VRVRSDKPLSARRRGVRTSWCARVPRAPAATATTAALGVATLPTARAMFQASPCGVVEAPERASAAGRRPASQVRGAGRARGCRTRRTGCLNAVSVPSQLLRLATPSRRRPRTRVARAPCAAMSAEGRLPRDEQEDGGLFDSLESLLSQPLRSDWDLREWCDPNAHNDTGASVHEGGAAGDAPCVPRVRARGASPSLATVLALAYIPGERARRATPKHARAPLGHLHAARRPYGARCSTQRRSVGRAVPACARCALRARGHAHARDWAAARA